MNRIFRSSKAALDLASIMVGVVVVGIIVGVVSATIWVVIPWSQDNAAKEALYNMNKAQEAHYATDRSFADHKTLVNKGYVEDSARVCSTPKNDGNDFDSLIVSSSGKVFSNTSTNLTPKPVATGTETCFGVLEAGGKFKPVTKPTILTLNCPAATAVTLPFTNFVGTVSWSDGQQATNSTAGPVPAKTLPANTSVTATLTGTYTAMSSANLASQRCLTSVEQFNPNSGMTSMSAAFSQARILTHVAKPPSSVTNMAATFSNATIFNGNISDWDTSNVTAMNSMFQGANAFNQPLDKWDVSKVKTFVSTFNAARAFDQNISAWSVDGATTWTSFKNNSPLSIENTPPRFR